MNEKEYIERNELIKNLNYFAPEHYSDLISDLIMKQPTADAAPVRHGHWITKMFYTYCSACDNLAKYDNYGQQIESDYCPTCGAKMDGD
ncbi:MAG: hypothetical protein ACI4J1_00325 [Ruminiclostridium sp.]